MLAGLPELVLDIVSGQLSYEDLQNLRVTCKALKQFVDGKKFTKLNLFVRKYQFYHRLFYTNEPIDHRHSLHSDDSVILHSSRFREQFAYVQRMIICTKRSWTELRGSDATAFDLNPLNHFRAISHLEVVGFTSISGKINLQELRIASFRIYCDPPRPESSIELDCPRLRSLRVDYCWPVLTGDTNQLEYLRYNPVGGPPDYLQSISPNLQNLSTICIETAGKTVELLSNLKTGHLILPSLDWIQLEPPFECTALGRLGELANCLEDLRRDSQRKQVQFTFCGRPIRSPDELRQISRLIEAHDSEVDWMDKLGTRVLRGGCLPFLNGNPKLDFLLSDAHSVYLHEDVAWSEEVVKKLKDIKLLEFRFLFRASLSTFEMFARTCQSLRIWMLYHQTVTGRLLEMLSKHLLNLESIRINNCKYVTLKPLTKFRNLEYLELDFQPPRDDLTFLFENSRTLETINIFGKDMVDLMRTTTGPKGYAIKINFDPMVDFDTFSAMVDYFYENCLFEVSEWGTSMRLDQFHCNHY